MFICDKTVDVLAMQAVQADAVSSSNRCVSDTAFLRDSCPSSHYCIPFFDVPESAQHYRGICCPLPSVSVRPACPVGTAHASSAASGCEQCPLLGYFCHRDARTSASEVVLQVVFGQ